MKMKNKVDGRLTSIYGSGNPFVQFEETVNFCSSIHTEAGYWLI